MASVSPSATSVSSGAKNPPSPSFRPRREGGPGESSVPPEWSGRSRGQVPTWVGVCLCKEGKCSEELGWWSPKVWGVLGFQSAQEGDLLPGVGEVKPRALPHGHAWEAGELGGGGAGRPSPVGSFEWVCVCTRWGVCEPPWVQVGQGCADSGVAGGCL